MTQTITRHDLERELRDRRDAALDAYRERGVDVYLDDAALRGDLALLLSLADDERAILTMKLAEVNGLRAAGLMDATHRLTPAGAEAAAAALIVRGL